MEVIIVSFVALLAILGMTYKMVNIISGSKKQ